MNSTDTNGSRQLVKKSSGDPEVLRSAIIADVNRFTGLSQQHDDMTLLCFGWTGGGDPREPANGGL